MMTVLHTFIYENAEFSVKFNASKNSLKITKRNILDKKIRWKNALKSALSALGAFGSAYLLSIVAQNTVIQQDSASAITAFVTLMMIVVLVIGGSIDAIKAFSSIIANILNINNFEDEEKVAKFSMSDHKNKKYLYDFFLHLSQEDYENMGKNAHELSSINDNIKNSSILLEKSDGNEILRKDLSDQVDDLIARREKLEEYFLFHDHFTRFIQVQKNEEKVAQQNNIDTMILDNIHKNYDYMSR